MGNEMSLIEMTVHITPRGEHQSMFWAGESLHRHTRTWMMMERRLNIFDDDRREFEELLC